MTVWLKHFKLKDLLDDDESDEAAIKVAEETAKRLRTEKPFSIASNEGFAKRFDAVKTCSQFNRVLSSLYDNADHERIWIE